MIPRELQDAFGAAILQYRDWGRGQAEPTVMLKQQPMSISGVCMLAEEFDDLVPDRAWWWLVETVPQAPSERTYRSAAQCLARLIRARGQGGDLSSA